jgi:FKBP-type peptidyl-prolyl cis-trans isomerase 2
MKIYDNKIKRAIPVVFLLLLALAGCAGYDSVKVSENQSVAEGRTVKVGDSTDIHYLCRLNNGEVVAATDSVAKDQPKSKFYLAGKESGLVSVTAVSPAGPDPDELHARQFEELISEKLARMIAGMKEGEKRQVELTAKDMPGSSEGRNTSRLALVRTRLKEMEVPIADFKYRTGKSPEVGDSYSYDPAFPGRVESVTEKAAVVRFSSKVKPGDVLETPFGPGLIREDDTHYYIDIDARKNTLVRAGTLIGRIADVDEKFMTIDFGNPFAHETLFCEVSVEKIKTESAKSTVEKAKTITTENTEKKAAAKEN